MSEKQPLKILCFHGGGTNGKVSEIPGPMKIVSGFGAVGVRIEKIR